LYGAHLWRKDGQRNRRKRSDKRGLSTDAIAEVTEERGTDWPREERDGEGGE